MREILFRGKGTCGLNAGDWIYGYYVKDFWKPTRCGCGIIPIDKERGGYCEVNPSTVGQYTGLTDKNGTKIFEGDILKRKHKELVNHSQKMTVNYIPYKACFSAVDIGGGNVTFISDYINNKYELEVIGNIHDNPKLLKEEL